jgi:uncharacterized protein (TIGR00255 family)
MTGFARSVGEANDCSWAWEVRSVNGKGLDARCRLPTGFEALELKARERATRKLKRGSVWMNLTVTRSVAQADIQVNTDALDRIIAILPDIQRRLPEFRPTSAEGLLGLRGMIEIVDQQPSEEERAALDTALLDGLDRTLDALVAMRQEEGARMAALLDGHLERIGILCADAERLAALQPEAIRERLREQVAALLETAPALPEDRLAQEVAVLATKADTREEVDRLKAHREAAAVLLSGPGPVGRKLEFLCQEFNREANTLCAKSSDVELTRIGIDLKATIDQLREQVQNIE